MPPANRRNEGCDAGSWPEFCSVLWHHRFVCASAALGALTPRRCLARWQRARGRCCWWIRFSSTTAQQRRRCGLPPNFARLAPTLRVGLLVPISLPPLAWQPPWDHGIAHWHAHLLLSLPQVLKFDHCQLTGVPVVVSKLTNLTCLSLKGFSDLSTGLPLWLSRLSGT